MTHRRPVSYWFYLASLLLIFSLLFSACSPAAPQAAQPAATQPPSQPAAPAAAPAATATQAPTAAVAPTATTATKVTPTTVAGIDISDFTPLTDMELAQPETYHNAIVFIAYRFPLWEQKGFLDPDMPRKLGQELWVIRPQEKKAGRVSPQGFNTALYQGADGKIKLISYETLFEKALLRATGWEEVLAPELCRLPAGGGAPQPDFVPCTELRFSADGRFLVYQIPIQSCSEQVRILNLEKRMHAVSEKERGHWSVVMPTGQILYALGHCEGGQVIRFDTTTGKTSKLGEEGLLRWNPQRTAFFTEVGDEMGYPVQTWAYNGETDRMFFNIEPWANNEVDNNPTWSPDGKAMLYERMAYTRDKQKDTFTFDRAMEIFSVDAATGKASKVATDPKFNYHVVRWIDDTLLIARYPYQSFTLSLDQMVGENRDSHKPTRCIYYAEEEDCGMKPELFGYNYKTGQLVPWAETGLPVPDQSAGALPYEGPRPSDQALYADPAGNYKLVASPYQVADGPIARNPSWKDPSEGSLWFVPPAGKPLCWVPTGWNFIVLP